MSSSALTFRLLYLCLCLAQVLVDAQQPLNKTDPAWTSTTSEYYAHIDPNSPSLKEDLSELISHEQSCTYAELWEAYKVLWIRGRCGTLLNDVYSSTCWVPGGDQCGQPSKPGDCYNREHSWPKSWWGGGTTDYAYTDLHHVWPADGYVNTMRSNLPLGLVPKPTFTSSNGCKVGPCDVPGFAGKCFEPALKGEMARAYFYMAVRYMDLWSCCDTEATDRSFIKPWLENLLRKWHRDYPVTADEIRRNQDIYANYQANRNPFIDFPGWVDRITDF